MVRPGALHGQRVLVVEDKPMVATGFAGRLRAGGIAIVGLVASVRDALELIAARGRLDAAVLGLP